MHSYQSYHSVGPLRQWTALSLLSITALQHVQQAFAIHHMKRAPIVYVNRRDDDRPLSITNQCSDTIWPGIATQAGTAPETQGFELKSGATRNLTVSADWQGRVWGRTNCSFEVGTDGRGVACDTGDCSGKLDCRTTGALPVSLAEFTLASTSGQAFYDISLVDGYNLALAIVSLYPESGNSSLTEIPPNLTNPICIATASLLGSSTSPSDLLLGTNGSFPLPLEKNAKAADLEGWCPWDLQLHPPEKPGDGVYPYPDDDIQRPAFQPCFSACAKWNRAEDCCTGDYGQPDTCTPGLYSRKAKRVCPDAYSFAYDDQTSTFIIPSGGGFGVVFCPEGRSTRILDTMGPQLRELAETGHVSEGMLADAMNVTLIRGAAAPTRGQARRLRWSVGLGVVVAVWMVL